MDTRFLRRSLPVVLALLATACGFAAEDGPGKPTYAAKPGLEVTTDELPEGSLGRTYPTTWVTASGVESSLEWLVTEGALPAGLDLDPSGLLKGTPEEQGLFTFTVTAKGGRDTASRTLWIAVDTFGVGLDGLRFGEVWSEEAITLVAVGRQGTATFEVLSNESRGAFDFLDPKAGRAVWIPGRIDAPCVDRIRVRDTGSGEVVEVVLEVLPHPAPDHVAEFGITDVWYVDCCQRAGAHAHAHEHDWDHQLQKLGLRSGAFLPTTADRLASWYVRRQLLSELNVYYERNADGTRGNGLFISFPMDRPGAPYEAPAPATWSTGAGHRYNVISVVHGENGGILGLAFGDSHLNELIENDTTAPGQDLGVFGNQMARAFNSAFQNNDLPVNPVSPDDEDILRDLVHGRSPSSERGRHIKRIADGFAHVLGMVVAHEIGHSLGLPHTARITPGSIMNGGAAIYPGAEYAFIPEAAAKLRYCLPGPGRMGGPTKIAAVPANGVLP